MITPELMGYIKSELAKGRKREDIHVVLVNEGGWGEADISEAFRTLIPMQTFVEQSKVAQNTVVMGGVINTRKSYKAIIENTIFIILGLACVFSWYFYQPQITEFLNFATNSFNFDKIGSIFNKTSDTPETDLVTEPIVINSVKDCGIGTTPDLKDPKTYEDDAVLTCLGNSALNCTEAKAVLKDVLFPNTFEIIRDNNQSTCHFKLSYGQDSALIDINGKNLAGQYISCPLGIVKSVDESKSTPSFNAPDVGNLSKYASQIYFYGTLGLFLENNVDQNKIQNLGCSGDYITSVISSYNKMKSKK